MLKPRLINYVAAPHANYSCPTHVELQKKIMSSKSKMDGLEATARNYVCMIAIDGMTCSSCVDLIHHAVSQLQGVNAVNVSKQSVL